MAHNIQITDRLGRKFYLAEYFQTTPLDMALSIEEFPDKLITLPIHGQNDLHIRGSDIISVQDIRG